VISLREFSNFAWLSGWGGVLLVIVLLVVILGGIVLLQRKPSE
jgi:hypothetical protein